MSLGQSAINTSISALFFVKHTKTYGQSGQAVDNCRFMAGIFIVLFVKASKSSLRSIRTKWIVGNEKQRFNETFRKVNKLVFFIQNVSVLSGLTAS